MKYVTPFDLWQAGFRMAQLGVEAQAVMAMRLMGLGGAWNTPFDEGWRMLREKPDAYVESWGRATEAAMRGKPPTRIMSAALDPLTRRTSSNRRRLAGRGPRKVTP